MNGKQAKALRKLVKKTCADTGVINERDLFQSNNKGSLELESKTVANKSDCERKSSGYLC